MKWIKKKSRRLWKYAQHSRDDYKHLTNDYNITILISLGLSINMAIEKRMICLWFKRINLNILKSCYALNLKLLQLVLGSVSCEVSTNWLLFLLSLRYSISWSFLSRKIMTLVCVFLFLFRQNFEILFLIIITIL